MPQNQFDEGTPQNINNFFANVPAIRVVQQANSAASTSSGGAVNIDNSLSTGAGLVVFSSNNSPAARLIVGRATGAANAQTVGYFEQNGTGHALHASNLATNNSTGSALNITSANVGASAVQIGGVETGRGTVKITHTGTGADANASAVSIDLQGASTASKGIFIDSVSNGTVGDLIDVRNNGNRLFTVKSDATFAIPTVQLGNGGPLISMGTGSPESVVTAPQGSLFMRTDGGTNITTLYGKRTGTGNTGWFPITV